MSSFDASQAPNFKQFLYKSELDFWIFGLIGQINSCGRSFWNNYIYKPIVGHTALQLGYGIRFERALDELLKAYILKTTPAANLAAAEQARWDTSPEFLKTPPMDSASVREEAMGVLFEPGKRMARIDPEILEPADLGRVLSFYQRLNHVGLRISPSPELNIVFAMTQAISVGVPGPSYFAGLTSSEIETKIQATVTEASKWASVVEQYFFNNPDGTFHRDLILAVLNNNKVSAAAREDPQSHVEL
ncbi:uncharacterized protein SAPINGB_P006200 [Magnusiomyces paraingens]|uniref:Uncharacterized protein n=1 Tax=Magnusiomyces paraingens TaxID=2606893 RepID=A0A5E8C4X7_9ASCO|nr:uncharacterized protein SAPINGB_P006200 [Saprochaete ingens]VVT58422.1 unnamed protein product [Saprochaete ingens]